LIQHFQQFSRRNEIAEQLGACEWKYSISCLIILAISQTKMIRTSTKAMPVASIHGEAPALALFPRIQRNGRYWNAPGGIFMTGGTGLLGRELVARLLACCGDEPIYLLIRGRDNSEVHKRFFSLCNYLGSHRLVWDRMRLCPVRGDITLPWFGLDRKDIQKLAGRVTRIIHSAACTNLNTSLQEARRTNLQGAWETLRLALSCRRFQSLVWISTAFVAGDRNGPIIDRKEFDDSATRAALRGTGLQCPRVEDYLDRLFDFCKRTVWGGQSGTDQHRLHCRPMPSVKGVAIC
jgi:hypothetical protein